MSGVNFGNIANHLGKQVQAAQTSIDSQLDDPNLDVSNMQSMLKLQMEFSKFQMETDATASMIKSIKDTEENIANKM